MSVMTAIIAAQSQRCIGTVVSIVSSPLRRKRMNPTILSPSSRATNSQPTTLVVTARSHKRAIADRTSGVRNVSAMTPRWDGPKSSNEVAMVIPPFAANPLFVQRTQLYISLAIACAEAPSVPSRVMLEMSLAMWSKSFSSATSASSWYLFSRHNLHRRVNADSLSETTDITPPSNSNHSRADDLDMRLSTSGMSLDTNGLPTR